MQFHTLTLLSTPPSGHRTCSFISHLNSPGSIQPCCHHGTGHYSSTQNLSLSYQVPTYSWVERVHVWIKSLPKGIQCHSNISPGGYRTFNLPLASRACYHRATAPTAPRWEGQANMAPCKMFFATNSTRKMVTSVIVITSRTSVYDMSSKIRHLSGNYVQTLTAHTESAGTQKLLTKVQVKLHKSVKHF